MIQFSCFSESRFGSAFTGYSAILSEIPIQRECMFNLKDTAKCTGKWRGKCTHQSLSTSTRQRLAKINVGLHKMTDIQYSGVNAGNVRHFLTICLQDLKKKK